ncbi:MAG: Asp23/Gls24 family envelope stress response protein [Candidatus Acetothermia bacterium]
MVEESYRSPMNKGEIEISKDVITSIAAVASTEVEGLGEMQSKAGLSGVFQRGEKKGVETELEDGHVRINLKIAVQYGYPVHEVARKVQGKVKSEIENMTGLEVSEVNIDVQRLEFEEELEEEEEEIEE